MLRLLTILSLLALLLWSCGPDNHRTCSGQDPAFKVVLKLTARPLPADTVVRVTYAGSSKEEFRLSDPDARLDVTFCKLRDEHGLTIDASAPTPDGAAGAAGAGGVAGAAGAGGAAGDVNPADPVTVAALYCELWTAGFTELNVSGSGFSSKEYELTRKADECTVEKELLLDAADAG